jgi:hypothetical protein
MKPNFYYKGQQHGIDIKKDVQNVGFKDDLVNGYIVTLHLANIFKRKF